VLDIGVRDFFSLVLWLEPVIRFFRVMPCSESRFISKVLPFSPSTFKAFLDITIGNMPFVTINEIS
jgi:hypothetical protein